MPDNRFESWFGRRECSFCGGRVQECGHGTEKGPFFHTRHLRETKVESPPRKKIKSETSQGKMIGSSSLAKMVASDIESSRGLKRSFDGQGTAGSVGKRVNVQSDIFGGGI
ncbi:hypothetical protein CORC01_12303 [Colletotrichum orchidophilum]|uniref:Uncharacterized protein n=1 Tax=Colletotrichum orchidophilum TaxID=1209926 RepID=A0A1G4ATF1_9PEZI|nr:uncharacterized protein CORC01_12303 [Colletotrichum orchidophilum]OHE92376.1 hypothetical protein CORC01_12303 [Colletotrichum orchidophilum]